MKFYSPTINLFFETDNDYIEFLSDLDYYSAHEPVKKQDETVSWPVGEIVNGEKRITIHFMHYESFEEAKVKWIERGKRINYDNLYVLWLVGEECGPSEKNYQRFIQMNFKNQLLITGNGFPFDDNVIKLDFIKAGNSHGKWAKHRGAFSSKRYIDEFDFVQYFNDSY